MFLFGSNFEVLMHTIFLGDSCTLVSEHFASVSKIGFVPYQNSLNVFSAFFVEHLVEFRNFIKGVVDAIR